MSLSGLRADEGYRAAVAVARTAGRSALDQATAAWATPHGVAAGDGVVLGELRTARRGLGDLAEALAGCGIDAKQVRDAIDRLVAAGLVDPVPLASQVGA
jgi:hypothetical protein